MIANGQLVAVKKQFVCINGLEIIDSTKEIKKEKGCTSECVLIKDAINNSVNVNIISRFARYRYGLIKCLVYQL